MEPLDDRELNDVLRQWTAPGAPPTLRARVIPGRPGAAARVRRAVRWLMTGTIRIPVPVGLAMAAVAAIWIYLATSGQPSPRVSEPSGTSPVVSLADFTPVERVEPRIVGEGR